MPFIIYDTEGEGYIVLQKVSPPDNFPYYVKMAICATKDRAEELLGWLNSNKGAF